METEMTALELTDKEVALVKLGLDILIRIHLGQVGYVLDPLRKHLICHPEMTRDGTPSVVPGEFEWPTTERGVREIADAASFALTGIRNGGPSLGNPAVSNEARRAYRLLGRIRGDKMSAGMFDEEGNPRS